MIEKIITDIEGIPIVYENVLYGGVTQDFVFCGMQETDDIECLYTPLYTSNEGYTLSMKTLKDLL